VEGLGSGNRSFVKRITINGQPRDTAAGSIAALVAELGFAKGTVLVEHNGIALRPAEWTERAVAAGDQIELLRLAAGG
jgi:thiamine biosynthesis protein ThiS